MSLPAKQEGIFLSLKIFFTVVPTFASIIASYTNMKKPIQISIPTPCHENWDNMTTADKGRFCASCQKTVFDFIKSSDREIASILKNTDNACGRFRNTQLDRDLIVPKEKSSLWMAACAAVVSFLTIGNHTISAQAPVNTEQHVSKTDEIIGKVAPPQIQTKTSSGIIKDGDTPLSGATIKIKSTGKYVSADIDGKFYLNTEIGETLIITYIGYTEKEIIIKNHDPLEINMEENIQGLIMGDVMRERTFFGRVFHSIGNIFR